MNRQGGGGGRGGEDTRKKNPSRTKVSQIQSLKAETHDSHLARLGGLPPPSIGTRKRTLTCTHTYTHTRSGARRWLLGSSASVRTNVFFSTTTVSAGFYKSTFLSRLVKHKQWEPKTQLWKNIDVKINHRYFLFFLLVFFPPFSKMNLQSEWYSTFVRELKEGERRS